MARGFGAILAAVVLVAASSANVARAAVNVTVFYETYCPDSQKLVSKQLVPTMERFGSDVVLTLVPFGHATYAQKGGKLFFSCQHGPKECQGNTLHACALHKYSDRFSNVVRFAACSMSHGTEVLDFIRECAMDNDFSTELLRDCEANPPEGPMFLKEMGELTAAAASVYYPGQKRLKAIPTTLVDGKLFIDEAVQDLPGLICREAVQKPRAC